MQQALRVDELLCHIFTQIEDYQTLFYLAYTCQAFKEPAVDALYSQLNGFGPLIKCLPRDLWVVTLGDTFKTITLVRPMNPNDWKIFRSYACRVRKLVHSSVVTTEVVSEGILDALLNPPVPTDILFPKLKSLDWCDSRIETTKFFRLLSGAPVAHISVAALKPNSYTPDCSPCLQLPCIQSLVLTTSSTAVASYLVCQAQTLRGLYCYSLTEDAMLHIASLPSLRTLEMVDVKKDSLKLMHQKGPDASIFQNLRSIAIQSDYPPDCLSFIQACQQKQLMPLTNFYMGTNKHLEDESSAILIYPLEALSSICMGSTLLSITIKEVSYGNAHSPSNLDILSHLFVFCNLVDLYLDVRNSFNLDDDDIKIMARAWPHLRNIRLRCDLRNEKQISLNGVHSLLEYCPNLRTLDIAIDVTLGLFDLFKRRNRCRNLQIRCIVCHESHVENPFQVAAIVSDILPNVGTIVTCSRTMIPRLKKHQRRWRETLELLAFFALARKQERIRCGYPDDEDMFDPISDFYLSSQPIPLSDDDDVDDELQ
ncbi:hypothetical protein BJ138DRAFT_1146842 [Hygrophoropsis aurantiaca]|uniref:Uncharacterized protein n=1 Tax=Hygrophoropsis aurantiaca TaxID=72124 RepID=A0ACB8AHV6_9AGAM|nr:hypothetical protein BJ138DRAFT_1146842 [Hygrophoropsis aurantiaca]